MILRVSRVGLVWRVVARLRGLPSSEQWWCECCMEDLALSSQSMRKHG